MLNLNTRLGFNAKSRQRGASLVELLTGLAIIIAIGIGFILCADFTPPQIGG